MVKQYEIYMLNLDPTIGSEMNKVRPCVVLSPNEIIILIFLVTYAKDKHLYETE